MTTQQPPHPYQLPLLGDPPADDWITVAEAVDAFGDVGVDETVLMARVESGTIRSRIANRGLELHPLDVDRWTRIESEIAAGLSRRNGGDGCDGIRAK